MCMVRNRCEIRNMLLLSLLKKTLKKGEIWCIVFLCTRIVFGLFTYHNSLCYCHAGYGFVDFKDRKYADTAVRTLTARGLLVQFAKVSTFISYWTDLYILTTFFMDQQLCNICISIDGNYYCELHYISGWPSVEDLGWWCMQSRRKY